MSKDAYEAFLAEVLAAVPQDRRTAIEGTLKDDQIAPKIRERVLARSDYSRNMDALRQQREQFEREVSEARQRIEGWNKWYAETSGQFATLQDQVNAYKSQFGDLEDGVPHKSGGLTEEQLNERLRDEFNRRDRDAIAFADVLTELKIEHRDKFKERLDTNQLLEFASQHGLPLQAAYREFVAPKLEEQREQDLAAKIAAAREEGKREALSQHKLPVASGYGEVHVLDRATAVGKTPNDRVRAAVEHWNSQGNHSYYD